MPSVDVSALVASLGLIGFALGFALRDALSNVLAGVLIYHPFNPGDKIKVVGFEGTGIQIDLRYTTLQAEDKKVLIPNSSFPLNNYDEAGCKCRFPIIIKFLVKTANSSFFNHPVVIH